VYRAEARPEQPQAFMRRLSGALFGLLVDLDQSCLSFSFPSFLSAEGSFGSTTAVHDIGRARAKGKQLLPPDYAPASSSASPTPR
jgi:hypothetical protein